MVGFTTRVTTAAGRGAIGAVKAREQSTAESIGDSVDLGETAISGFGVIFI